MGKKSKAKRKNNNKSNKPKNVTDTTVTDTPAVTEEVTAETVEQVDTPVANVTEEAVETNESETAASNDADETETPVVQEDAKPDDTDAEKEADETIKDETVESVQDDAPVKSESDVTKEEVVVEVEQEVPVEETQKEEEIIEQEPSIEESSTEEVTPKVESSDPRPIVIAGPSGAGKGTLINILMKKFPKDQFGFSVSHTTRNPREGEVNGVHYNFSTVDAMKEEIDDGKFIEYAEVHGNYYGTSVEAVRSVQSKGQVCILDIDCQGVRNVKSSSLDPYYIFIAPPSMQDLENRLRGRGTEKEEDIVKRLANAQGEMDYGQEEGNFDKYLVNDDLKSSSEELCNTIQTWYPHLVPDENSEEKEEVSVDEAAADDQEEKTVEQIDTEVDKEEAEEEQLQEEQAPDDEINMDASEATTEVVDNCSLEDEETTGEEAIEPKVDAPMDEVSPSDEDEEVVEVQVEEVKETVVEEEHPEDECEKVDVPQSPEPVAETKVEDVKAVEPSTPEPVEVKPAVIQSPEVVKEEPKSMPAEETKEVIPEVNPNKTYYTLEELKTPIEGVEWAQRENFLSDEDIQTHFGMNRDELLKLPKWKKQAAKKKLGIF